MHDVLDPAEMVSDELIQRKESGYDVAELEEVVLRAVESGSPAEMDAAYTRLEQSSLRADWPTRSRRRSRRSAQACLHPPTCRR